MIVCRLRSRASALGAVASGASRGNAYDAIRRRLFSLIGSFASWSLKLESVRLSAATLRGSGRRSWAARADGKNVARTSG